MAPGTASPADNLRVPAPNNTTITQQADVKDAADETYGFRHSVQAISLSRSYEVPTNSLMLKHACSSCVDSRGIGREGHARHFAVGTDMPTRTFAHQWRKARQQEPRGHTLRRRSTPHTRETAVTHAVCARPLGSSGLGDQRRRSVERYGRLGERQRVVHSHAKHLLRVC
mmetsp:Transcript_4789/g.10486  ORF Transcript_4789/g.10486 Transcript_4789/m.10486 type:complete len:170 (+) Transcript_4789:64-573(+)